jgi:hypothetical protein
MQNVKDNLSNDRSRNSIDIWFTAQDDFVEFKHNGSLFTPAAMFGLLYKYRDRKENAVST